MTLEEAKEYLHIDYEEPLLPSIIEEAEIYIDFMVGEGYKTDEKAVKLAGILQKKLINDMYENRSAEVPEGTKQDKIVTSILDKLSLF
ncbi:uncharacterized phage protein (possible DNA packaging) [Clostridium frigidicarnis]|uniref:Uncharacterized phage protein (Possible DNA packaging) n=1 Tax=Clostridium frigidicarnis TaxID=84698 RepID=A0A1I0V1P4_9CLOT|nr:head-tail connector protein [Clostridium frigidicarnis]SFA70211.1 uncharacterized phage protein (possible DNA packaging) [Clostridium frigidicarnis]